MGAQGPVGPGAGVLRVLRPRGSVGDKPRFAAAGGLVNYGTSPVKVASLSLAAGKFLVWATGTVIDSNVTTGHDCVLTSGGTTLQEEKVTTVTRTRGHGRRSRRR